MSTNDRALHGDQFLTDATRLLDQASSTPIKHVAAPLAGAQVYATLALVAAVRDVADRLDSIIAVIKHS